MSKASTRTSKKDTNSTSRTRPGGSVNMSRVPIDKVKKDVGQILMLATESDGTSFYVNGVSHKFFVPASHNNYTAMVSLLLAAHSRSATIAVKYPRIPVVQKDNRRTVTALATGVHAVISGGSF